MIPEQIMLIMAFRRKTDTAAAMPVITTLLDVNAELCAQNAEGAVVRASFEKQLFDDNENLNIAVTSTLIYNIIPWTVHFVKQKVKQIHKIKNYGNLYIIFK